jgi:anaerobic selenocysteine-containing dehydrogenase
VQELRKTTCNRDCPDACGIVATVEDGRVVKIGGDPEHPVTQGFLCYRTNHYLDTQYAPDRLTAPLFRERLDQPFRAIGWDEALDLAARKLVEIRRESGPAAIFHYRSGGTLGLVTGTTDRFFERFGPVTTKRGDICSGAGDAAQMADFGAEDSNDLFDLLNARHILLWGKNVFVSGPHTIPVLNDARARGAELVLIDPVHHRTASLCQAFVQPRPGGDLALALAVARVLFERGWAVTERCDHVSEFRALAFARSVEENCTDADVPVAVAHDLARRLHEGPTTILVGWGMGRRVNGSAIVRALDALVALSGNLGVPGGGSSFYFKRRGAFDTTVLATGASPRTVCEPLFGHDILAAADPPIRAVWITAGNPVAMLPDSKTSARALETRDFVVVVDLFLTDTAQRAHLVLPTTSVLEADDVVGAYGHHYLGVARPVVPPPPGVRSDLEIMQGLAARVGLADEMAGDARSWKQRLLSKRLAEHGVTLEAIEAGPVRNPLAAQVFHAGGRTSLMTGLPAPLVEEPFGPLFLLSISSDKSQSSQWARPQEGPAVVTLHPDAAAGIPDGGAGRLVSPIGALEVRVRHDPRQRRDVALMAKGGHLGAGRCANALIRARTTDAGEGGALYDERVRLEPAAPMVSAEPSASAASTHSGAV